MRDLRASDVLVLWLRASDLKDLPDAPEQPVFVSGLMGGLENAPLPPAWRSRAQMAYPVDLPDRRRVRVDYALSWFRLRKIPLVAPQVQADTLLACGLLSETLRHLIDALFRDYMIERIEDDIEHRIITGYYPRLTLATKQRFASKGGYVVRFASDQGTRLVVERDWSVPD